MYNLKQITGMLEESNDTNFMIYNFFILRQQMEGYGYGIFDSISVACVMTENSFLIKCVQ